MMIITWIYITHKAFKVYFNTYGLKIAVFEVVFIYYGGVFLSVLDINSVF